jgi:hypothetical protein
MMVTPLSNRPTIVAEKYAERQSLSSRMRPSGILVGEMNLATFTPL